MAPSLSTPWLVSAAFAGSNPPNYGAHTCFLHFSHFPQASVQNTCHLVSHVRCRCCWHWCPLPYMAPVYKCKSQRGNCKRSRNVSSKAAWIGFRVEHIVREGWPMLSVGSGGCLTTAQVGRANNEFNWTKATATTPIGGQPCLLSHKFDSKFLRHKAAWIFRPHSACDNPDQRVISKTIPDIPIHFQDSNKV